MTRQLVLKQVIVLFYLLFIATPATSQENFGNRLLMAHNNSQPAPHYSQINTNASEADAYEIQKSYVALRSTNDTIAGYKAGLTSEAGQQKFNVSQALSGILFSSGHVADAKAIQLSSANRLMLETEIGFILGKPITQPLETLAELRAKVASVVAVIELPDLGYETPQNITGIDLIAANVAAHQYLMGDPIEISAIENINDIKTVLSFQGKSLFTGDAKDALGDQWQALFWLVNHLLDQGYQLMPGEILITGALGKMIPASAGEYEANFDALGKIHFKIKP